MAIMSGKVYSNTGAPNNADGVDGDIYLQLDGFKTTYRKEGGAWVAIGSTLGAIPDFISGTGNPSNAFGQDGQYYRNTDNQDIWYKQGSTWNNIGNFAGGAFTPRLEQAGIGKDLATPPNLINAGSLNTVIESGEYYYTVNVTDRPSPYGLLKVWRENSTYIYQIVQTSNNDLFHRYTNNGGANWTTWKTYAGLNGDAGQRFKVAPAVDADDAVRFEQLSSASVLFQSNRSIFTSAGLHSFNLQAGQVIRVILVGGGGGGGGIRDAEYAYANGPMATDGGFTSIYPQGNPAGFFFKCQGGVAGESPRASNGGNYVFGSHGYAREVETTETFTAVTLSHQEGLVKPSYDDNLFPPTFNHPTLKALFLTSRGQGGKGGSSRYGRAGSGSGGAFVEGLIKNTSTSNVTLVIDLGEGGLGNSANEGVGLNGESGLCIIFY